MPALKLRLSVIRSSSGAFDLPSILIGITVISVLAVGVLATIFGAVPWAQNRAAAQDLAALTTAQGTAKARDNTYAGPDLMAQLGYLSDNKTLDFAVAADESCWVGVTQAKSGKHFYTVNGSAPAQLTPATRPGCLEGGPKFDRIVSGSSSSCGIAEGAVWCWGLNSSGQLGDGTMKDSSRPVRVTGLEGETVTDVSTGVYHRCAITSGGKLYCWGRGNDGEIGGGTRTMQKQAVPVGGVLAGRKVTAVSAAIASTCAVSEEKLYCWGRGSGSTGSYTLGDAARSSGSAVPVLAAGGALAGVSVKTVVNEDLHACALSTAGKAYCWGNGTSGQVGDGRTAVGNPLPAEVDMSRVEGGAFDDLALSNYSTCATGSGTVYCWGGGTHGATGSGSVAGTSAPKPVQGVLAGKKMVEVTGAMDQFCASDEGGSWYCWGRNQYGSLGTGDLNPVLEPKALPLSGSLNTARSLTVSVGGYQTCALQGTAVSCVGFNSSGNLGDGTSAPSVEFVPAAYPLGMTSWVDTVLNGGKLS